MAGRTRGAERDARRILAEAGVAAIEELRGKVATLEARLAEVERERDAALAELDAPETCDHCGEPCVDYRQRDGERWCIGCVSVEADARIAEYRALRDRAFADEAEVDAALGAAGVPLGENPPDGAVGLRCYSRAERIGMLVNERDAALARIREFEEALRALRDADRDRVIVSKQKTSAADTPYWRTQYAADTRYWRARCAAYALISPTPPTEREE